MITHPAAAVPAGPAVCPPGGSGMRLTEALDRVALADDQRLTPGPKIGAAPACRCCSSISSIGEAVERLPACGRAGAHLATGGAHQGDPAAHVPDVRPLEARHAQES